MHQHQRIRPNSQQEGSMLIMKYLHTKLPAKHCGVSMVEVLVTLLVTSVGLLGIAALHLSSLRNNFDSNSRSYASMLAADIADRMRGNRIAASSGEYSVGYGAVPPTAGTAQNDVTTWRASLTQALPSGDGSISVVNNIATITVRWEERGAGLVTFTTITEF
jgi:type IV pilus assembly protein PilV